MSCLAAKPIVNGIEKDLAGRAKVVRLNLLSKIGRALAHRFEVRAIPTLVVLDANRKVIYRHTGIPNRQTVVAQL